ncbi:MAG: enoyl-CoA hydratase, partial [Pseudomonas sp.]|nr:enoyl-CoA hydratase [Pseudomonas sp.]
MTQSNSGRVSREKRGQIMMIGLDRASKRNAFDLPLLDDMCRAYGEFERDSDARVALVFAHGEHFTAG